ncbi:MAG: hypothetical protein AAGU19_17295 [Prolixibacteraceae bacterium]
MSKQFEFFIPIWNHRKRILLLLVSFVLISCNKHEREDEEVVSSSPYIQNDLVLSSDKHLAFPDLTWYNNNWFITFRVSDAHIKGTFNEIKVYKSTDFHEWVEINGFEYPGYDLRDPKFSYNALTDSLYLHIHAASEGDNYAATRRNLIVNFEKKSNIFRFESISNFKMHPQYPIDWLWRPVWYKGSCFVGGYSGGSLRLYQYSGLKKSPIIFPFLENDGASESTIKFLNERMYCIVRRGGQALFGVSQELANNNSEEKPYMFDMQWNSLPFLDLGGPNMIIDNERAYIGGRIDGCKTAIITYSIPDNKVDHIEELYSFGDNSYPGMILKDSKIYGLYYTQSSSGKFQIRSIIYDLAMAMQSN